MTTLYRLNAGDYVQTIVNQTSGGSLSLVASPNNSPEFSMTWIGP